MLRKTLFIVSLLLCPFSMFGQAKRDTLSFKVVSYNVENLFDCHDDPLKADNDFLPTAVRHWTYKKYRKKLDDIARVITLIGKWELPALVALCEVENDTVLRDLTKYSLLKNAGYRFISTHSDDVRGIDVALLYRRELFKPLQSRSLRIPKPEAGNRPTRDILHVSGLLLTGDTLDVMVCHFPSRFGGQQATEPYRMSAAHEVRRACDSLMSIRKHPLIIIAGDMNDQPKNRSLKEVLQAQGVSTSTVFDKNKLYDLLAEKKHRYSSYKYKGDWMLFDHLIVSGRLLQQTTDIHTSTDNAYIFYHSSLLENDKRYGGKKPFRTYNGMRYQGGYSDHLPIVADFTLIY